MTQPHARLWLCAAGLVAGLAAAPAHAQAVRPQDRLTCNFSKANRGYAPGATIAPLVKGAFSPIPLESVQLIDKDLRRKVVAQAVEARRTETETVEVLARIVNCTDKPLQLQVRTTFMSESQAPTEPTSGWSRMFLQARSTGVYSEKSMSVAAAHYLIEVRKGD